MGNAARGLEQQQDVLTVECVEGDREVVRTVTKVPLTIERLRYYYEKLKDFDTLFNDFVDDEDDFIEVFVNVDDIGQVHATGLIWQVDDVGIVYMTDIRPGIEFKGHFSFWDRRLSGREPIIEEMLEYIFGKYEFHRAVVEIPLYAKPAMKFVERIGFKKEGRKRDATRYKGEWFDVNLYSMLEDEV